MVGRIDDLVIELLDRVGLQEVRLGLGTPDLAAASKLMTDENQRRLACLGQRGASR